MKEATLFTDFLTTLGVSHTADYSARAFKAMPFQSCFGLKKLMEHYGIDSEAYDIADKDEVDRLSTPFLAQTQRGFVIVTDITPQTVTYLSRGVNEMVSKESFKKAWNGIVFLAFPSESSCEPEYGKHRAFEDLKTAKKVVLALGGLFLFLYFFISRGLWSDVSNWFIALFDFAGLFFTFLLVQKGAHVKSGISDKVCGVLEKGGCDSVLATKASSFFGIFNWSEVGFAYFSISLLTLLLFPQWTCYLALCNACCLPFTFWSIWYQKFRAKAWCTLCVFTQATLWCLFFSYLLGGHFAGIFPLRIQLIVLGAAYLTMLLLLNITLPLIENIKLDSDNEKS